MSVHHKILKIGPRAFVGLLRPWFQPKAGTLALAGLRAAYMLVLIKNKYSFGVLVYLIWMAAA